MIRRTQRWLWLGLLAATALTVTLVNSTSVATGAQRERPGIPVPETVDQPTQKGPEQSCVCDPEERQLLFVLKARREQLEQREGLLAEREKVLNELERSFEKRLDDIYSELERLEKLYEVGEAGRRLREKKVIALAATVQTLSPRKAAPMLANAAPNLAAMLLGRLPPERSGALLARMEPRVAAVLMQAMVEKSESGSRAGFRGTKSRRDRRPR